MTVGKTPTRSLILILFLFPVIFYSCSARIDGVFREGGEADLSIRASLEPRTLALIRSLQSFAGEASDAPILDGMSISLSMAAVPGVRTVSIRNTSSSALEGSISISNVEYFFAEGDSNNRFISYKAGPGGSSMVITLDRNSAPELIARLSPEIGEYLSALFAPVVLGDNIDRQEYLSLLASIYGRPLADEIAAAGILVRIEFPRQIIAVQGGNHTGRQAEFNIPVLDILVLESPLHYEVRW